jgi:hypothetical protein
VQYPDPKDKRFRNEKTHLLAAQFGGSNETVNIVTMYVNGNRSNMYGVETQIGRMLDAGERVFFAALPQYPANNPAQEYLYGRGMWPIHVDITIITKSMREHFSVTNQPALGNS